MTPKSMAICIVTKDRTAELRRCLQAIFSGESLPREIIVSDDGSSTEPTRELVGRFEGVTHVRPARRGMCAARNSAARAATTTHVSFIDDDCIVAPDFVSRALRLIEDSDDATVVTGAAMERGALQAPASPSFLGFHKRAPKGTYRNISMNSNIFPRSAFTQTVFDETIVYGHDEVDAAAGLIARGYRIACVPDLVNRHEPPERSDGADLARQRLTRRSRFYTGLKRYSRIDRRPVAALAFLVLAPCHEAAHVVRRGRPTEVAGVFVDMAGACRDVWRLGRRGQGDGSNDAIITAAGLPTDEARHELGGRA